MNEFLSKERLSRLTNINKTTTIFQSVGKYGLKTHVTCQQCMRSCTIKCSANPHLSSDFHKNLSETNETVEDEQMNNEPVHLAV